MNPHRRLAVVSALHALVAYAGSIGLMGGGLRLGADLEARLPFESPVLGGLALALIVGIPATALSALAWRGDRLVGPAALATGGLLIAWIVVQLAFIRELSFFHPLYIAVGILFIRAGLRRSVTRRSERDHDHQPPLVGRRCCRSTRRGGARRARLRLDRC